MLKDILYQRQYKNSNFVTNKPILEDTARRVEQIWSRTNIPIIANRSVMRKISKLFDDYCEVMKINSKRGEQFSRISKSFREKTEITLFDISKCKCEIDCKCAYIAKVPLNEKNFLFDQRIDRKLFF